jgi:hypothetical protein
MQKNIQELPLELLIKCVKNNNTFNNNMFLRMTSKKISKQMIIIDKEIFDKLIVLWTEENRHILINNIWRFQFQKANNIKNLSHEQLKVYKSDWILYHESQFESIGKILCDQTDAIKKLVCDQTKTLLENSTEHITALFNFNIEQIEALWEFNIKQANVIKILLDQNQDLTTISKILKDQEDETKIFHCIQDDAIKKIQFEQTKALLELQFEHNKALKKLEFEQSRDQNKNITFPKQPISEILKTTYSIEYDKIRKLQFEQTKAIYELQFKQSCDTYKFNYKFIQSLNFLQRKNVEAHFKCMINNVKKIILETRQDDYNGMKKLTQKHFNISISKISDKISDKLSDKILDNYIYNKFNKYFYNQIPQVVIFLYLIKESNFELDLNLISETVLNNSHIKYFKIIFPMLNNVTKFNIDDYENDLTFSLELIELISLLPNLENLHLKFNPANIDFKVPQKKLKINELDLSTSDCDNKTNNIITILKMCPDIKKLYFDGTYLDINNEYLVKIAKILKQSNKLINLTLNSLEFADDEQLDFENVILQCPNLINLNLSHNNIENKRAIGIAQILSKSTTLTYLDLADNIINEEGEKKIREILLECKTLKTLIFKY